MLAYTTFRDTTRHGALFRLVYRKVFAPVLAAAHLARSPVHSPLALRALDLQVCPHTTLLPHKKPVSTCVNTGLTCMLCGASSPQPLAPAATRLPCQPAPATCTYAKRSTPSLETRAKNSGSSSGAFSPKTRASRKMRSPSSRRLSSPVRSVAMTSPFST